MPPHRVGVCTVHVKEADLLEAAGPNLLLVGRDLQAVDLLRAADVRAQAEQRGYPRTRKARESARTESA
jgi:hypothetical protein